MEGSITGILKSSVEGFDLESIVGVDAPKTIEQNTKETYSADLSKVKDLIRDVYRGLNVKELKKRHTSFDLNFNRNWSWENRVKNVESILEQYLTLDNYVNSVDKDLDQPERFIASNNYLSILQDIDDMTNSFIKKLDKRHKKVKNYDNVVNPSLTRISEYLNNNFDEISDYEANLSRGDVKLDLFSPSEPIYRDEPVPLPLTKRAEDFPYEVTVTKEIIPETEEESFFLDEEDSNKNYFDTELDQEEEVTLDIPLIPIEPLTDKLEYEEVVVEQNREESSSQNQPEELTNYNHSQQRIEDYINREQNLARINVKSWFSKMTRVKNPAKYLESKLESIGYISNSEQEIVQAYSDELNERISSPFWRTVFGEKEHTGFFSKISNYFENRKVNSIEKVINTYTSKWNSQSEILREREVSISRVKERPEQDDFTEVLTRMVQGDNGRGRDIDRIDHFMEPHRSRREKSKLVNGTVATALVGGSLIALGFGAAYANHANETNQSTLDWINNFGKSQELNLSYLDTDEFVANNMNVSQVLEEPVEEITSDYVPLTIDKVDRMKLGIPKEIESRFREISSDYQFNPTFMNYFPGEMNLSEESVGLQEDQEKVVMLSYGVPNPVILRGAKPEDMNGFNSLTEHSQYFINEIYHTRGGLPKGELFITGNGFDAEVSQVVNGKLLHTSYQNGRPVANV